MLPLDSGMQHEKDGFGNLTRFASQPSRSLCLDLEMRLDPFQLLVRQEHAYY
jgi:hypothetical protein